MTEVSARVLEKPIIFSAEMVQAILEGRKTQTRRVAKGTFRKFEGGYSFNGKGLRLTKEFFCPYGQPGDRLWVKEKVVVDRFGFPSVPLWAAKYNGGEIRFHTPAEVHKTDPVGVYSPRFMPRWAARLFLEIVEVRVEKLQDISNDDAVAEGVEFDEEHGNGWKEYGPGAWPGVAAWVEAKDSFMNLWQVINGKRAPWASNPWVWVIEFKVVAEC